MPQATQRLTGVKKRQQIADANRTMFMWIVIASIAISFCAVTSQFLFQRLTYNNNVIGVKAKAADTLAKNIINAKKLQEEVNGLVANQDLASVKINPDDSNTKSVLDALPSKADPTGLATSLQRVVLNHSSVIIESITVPSDSEEAVTSDESGGPQEQHFSFTVSGSYDKIRAMMLDLERTIRPMNVQTINLNGNDADMRVTVEALTYYQPTKNVSIKQKVVK